MGQGLSGGVRRETEVEVLGPRHRYVVWVNEAAEADTGHRPWEPKEKEQVWEESSDSRVVLGGCPAVFL